LLHQQETEDLKTEVAEIKTSLGIVQVHQDDMVTAVDGVNSAVTAMGSQLTSMSKALDTLLLAATQYPQKLPVPEDVPEASTRQPQSPTIQQLHTTAELRQRLALEQEKTKVINLLTQTNLPPLNTGRRLAPPGFTHPQQKAMARSRPVTPDNVRARPPRTPVFHQF
jgi:hypothetical protein